SEKNHPLLFLHGACGKHDVEKYYYNRLIEHLAKEFHVYAPNHPGFRSSQVPDTDFGIEDYYGYVGEFINRSGIKNPIIVGQSFGAKLACGYAMTNPDKVRSLVLTNPAIFFDIKNKIGLAYCEKSILNSYQKSNKIRKKLILKYTLGPDKLVKSQMDNYENVLRLVFKPICKKYADDLKKITCHVRIMFGVPDLMTSLKDADRLNSLLRNSELHKVPYGHFAIFLNRRKLVSLIKDTL
ncbi:MAG: alpha/beta hydrolase, partial [Nanoarchaeota archaeon]|nr:alpha/beta hydrolase [Nanoarchaeota archaeon]